ncbi:hypothetical protein [Sciscionella marina]|uniref:hypothetical protein n=1 Tax=Sciscionella marina TaxID=508770 RepID=UPI0003685D73|nr:hypothetical protein [Sciscionella marina]
MPEQRRRFSAQFKAEAVQVVIETENPDAQQPVSPSERVRVAEMEDEIRRLRMENEFLGAGTGTAANGIGDRGAAEPGGSRDR